MLNYYELRVLYKQMRPQSQHFNTFLFISTDSAIVRLGRDTNICGIDRELQHVHSRSSKLLPVGYCLSLQFARRLSV